VGPVERLARLVCAVLLLAPPAAFASEPGPHARIANGVATHAHASTGALLIDGFQACSGTLVGCRTFLTAAHCVCSGDGSTCNPDESAYQVFLQHAGLFPVGQITPHPAYVSDTLENDIAVVTLDTAVQGLAPTPLATSSPAFGSAGTIVGFGTLSDAPQTGSGLKRRGAIVTADCRLELGSDASNDELVCWDFDTPAGPPGTDSNTCPGDSGGPLFTDESGTQVISGITSFGIGPCASDDFSGDTNVASFGSWVAGIAGGDLANARCSALPQVGEPGAEVDGFAGSLAGTAAESVHGFAVAPGTQQVRVIQNGQDDGVADFDLWVRFGSPPTATERDCTSESAGQFEVCTFTDPAPGTWYATARSWQGAGEYQITATAFTDVLCGDGLVHGGETCDDGNTAAGDGCGPTCRSESGVCGDGTEEPPEQCDDGNTAAGDGCDPTCVLEIASGGCPALPDEACVPPQQRGSKLKLSRGRTPGQNRLSWTWKAVPAEATDFGDPLDDTDYRLCLYDELADTPTLALEAAAPAGALWSARSKGLKFDGTGGPGQLKQLKVRAGSKLKLRAKGRGIALPTLPVAQDGAVRLQLQNALGTCWEARYEAPAAKSDDGRFVDRSAP
jgi:cysteine-rich repeat protein